MSSQRTRVAVVGVGGIGSALATLFARHGHEIVLAARNPGDAAALAAEIGAAPPVTYRAAAQTCPILCLCVPWPHSLAAIDALGDLAGKVVIDVTNPEAADGRSLAIGHSVSGAEMLAARAPAARFVKAFNYVYAELLQDAEALVTLRPSIFHCGDHDDANAAVTALIRSCGLEPVHCGPLRDARYLEPLAMLMVELVRERHWGPAAVAMRLAQRKPSGATAAAS